MRTTIRRLVPLLLVPLAAMPLALCLTSCVKVRTESEVKPIHITVDVNIKVDRELDKFFDDIDKAAEPPQAQ